MKYRKIYNYPKKIPPWCLRYLKTVGRGAHRFSMCKPGDTILIGISGGKDSLTLAFALALRKKMIPVKYRLQAFMIEWKEYPYTQAAKANLKDFFKQIEIPFRIKRSSIYPKSFKKKFNCYLCTRNKKRILFEQAKKMKIKKIALGHHLDDIIEI